ncbi:GNAT family N-acetyltransferase [uncultured Pigmentiphaga sp.]|jgi:predicted N-acyltransferase|uniref:GNAT family N-acetyltransferase n=1 Tax=uncultured Pigmentiphaga sp. TaxID=340361 RepID=UPI0026135053|nr:GNAT family N-acetyltransferase [uncultured Pigmentiphaga sp.]
MTSKNADATNVEDKDPSRVSDDYVIRLHDDPAHVDAARWDALLAASPHPTPFLSHAFLEALHASGSATADTGWQPQFLTVERDGELVGACPLYLKSHSWGEFVFDWAWADAYRRHGLAYYPKLVGAVPFTPVPGSRLLARDDAVRAVLLAAMEHIVRGHGLSSVHLLFLDEADRQAAQARGWMMRRTVQFHWHNRTPEPYRDFADFLASLQREKRKKIQQERRRVAEAGVSFTCLSGPEITADDWDFFHACYCATYHAHRSTPYLTRDFFTRVAEHMPQHWLLFVAQRDGRRIASSLVALDPLARRAFGRYWGALEAVPCLHFEACYYQPLDWCIAHGYQVFEGGAQGEHKMARGLLPVQAWSAHWLAHPAFADAVAEYLAHEGEHIGLYVDELREHSPFKAG